MELSSNYNQIQSDEIETLKSIYENEFVFVDVENRIFEITIKFDINSAIIQFSLPNEYPDSPPICEIATPWLRGEDRTKIEIEIHNLVFNNLGCPVIYQLVECIREEINKSLLNSTKCEPKSPENNKNLIVQRLDSLEILPVFHGDIFIDRKSTFQAHIARVTSEHEISNVRQQLLSNNKIAIATHNISAYRIRVLLDDGKDRIVQSCDDDGENKAAERLLNMIVLMGVENIYVVVSRWFGGIKLGPDRFKHINNTAKEAIVQSGWFSCHKKNN